MNFQSLIKVESSDFYLDIAFSRAKKKASEIRTQVKGTRLEKSIKIELAKLDEIKATLNQHMELIIKSFPSIDDLAEFYKELIKATLDYPQLKKSLGSVNWARTKIVDFHKKYHSLIKNTKHLDSINKYRREFYGRISSIMKNIKPNLKYLEESRNTMKDFPSIKTKLKTVAIFGFPNTGKTTLLSKLTSSKPEIASYAFTTKGINVGYMKKGHNKIQIIDTPGTLDRFDKMNSIEKQAWLALKYLADEVIYVFDITEPFPLKDQDELFRKMKRLGKPVHVYLSKTDVLKKEDIKKFRKDFLTLEEIKEKI
ncbi:50S ribosome-binding GTPase [Candidatus Woesearchaeota archaeon]|nr:50S ribosome-binding GTPase [Candidatus Woesearchaeota archaeon]